MLLLSVPPRSRAGSTMKRKSCTVIKRQINSELETPNTNTQVFFDRKDFKTNGTLSDKIAGSTLVSKYWYYPGGRELFPLQSQAWYVEKYYPYAEGGPLCVDEPEDLQEIEICKIKAKHLINAGVRYLWISKSMSEIDALIQLKEFDKCLGLHRSMN